MALLIFDFDGTLADTRSSIVETFQLTLDNMGLQRIEEEKIVGVIGLPLKENFTVAAGFTDEAAEEAVAFYRDIFMDVARKKATLFPGVLDVFKTLAERGIPRAIASARSQASLDELVEILGLAPYVDHLYGEGCVEHSKPAPDMALHIMDVFGEDPSRTLVIGDTIYDIEMGKAAGCYTCAVTYGNHSREKLAGAGPDYIVDDLRKIL